MLSEKSALQGLTPPCAPGAERFTAKARLLADVREVLPYLNATLRGAMYFPDAPALTWKKAGHNVAFHPYEIAVSNAVDRESALEMLAERASAATAAAASAAPAPERGAAKEPPGAIERVLKSPAARSVAGQITRSLMGALLGTPPRRRRRSLF